MLNPTCLNPHRMTSLLVTHLIVLSSVFTLGTFAANQGSIRVCNRGAYVAKCGLESRTRDGRSRSYETDNFPVAQCSTLDLPYEAVWGRFWCDNFVFVGVRRAIFQEEFGTPTLRCYDIGGTTFHPSWSQTGC